MGIAMFFVSCLVTTQLLMSRLSLHYKHPGFVTMLHFGCVWVVSCVYWVPSGFSKWWSIQTSSNRSNEWFLRNIVPLALSNPLTVAFNNTALTYVGAGMCAIVGTLSPVSVAIFSWICGHRLSFLSWNGIFVAFSGALLIAFGEISTIQVANHSGWFLGVLFALASVGARSLKIVIMDLLMAPTDYQSAASSSPLSPMELYSMQAPWCFVTSLFFAMTTESIPAALKQLTPETCGLILVTCVSAVLLNFAGIFALKELGASSQQIIGKLNTICVAAISMAFLQEQLSRLVLLGSAVVLSGAALVELGKEPKHDATTPKRLSAADDLERAKM